MQVLQQVMRHPAGRIGVTLGLTFGLIATLMGKAGKALLFAGFCRFLAGKMKFPR
ncbi:hypothetical protein KDW_56170 [Dictyobacter vulcani]|uniref:Uncharacterized protein n=1 Tax=Dictyobacter vulcani TaxID=2607529 RepID=A0A5J4KU75_9CHLR|nr:hypothetical protein KDW_56170 [Dictyobacter vulcani]